MVVMMELAGKKIWTFFIDMIQDFKENMKLRGEK